MSHFLKNYTSMSNTQRTYLQVFLAVVFIFAFTPLTANAAMMPWESFTCELAKQVTGPWVKWLAVISIALGGIMFGLGELNGPFSKIMQIAGGFSFAVSAVTVVGMLVPSTMASSCGI
jgi:type IV secretory pathway VirB2 component (pilin)